MDLKQQQGTDTRDRLLDAQKRIVKVSTTAAAALEELRVGLAALETDQARSTLKDTYRAQRRAELRAQELKKVGVDGDQALALASALKRQRGTSSPARMRSCERRGSSRC